MVRTNVSSYQALLRDGLVGRLEPACIHGFRWACWRKPYNVTNLRVMGHPVAALIDYASWYNEKELKFFFVNGPTNYLFTSRKQQISRLTGRRVPLRFLTATIHKTFDGCSFIESVCGKKSRIDHHERIGSYTISEISEVVGDPLRDCIVIKSHFPIYTYPWSVLQIEEFLRLHVGYFGGTRRPISSFREIVSSLNQIVRLSERCSHFFSLRLRFTRLRLCSDSQFVSISPTLVHFLKLIPQNQQSEETNGGEYKCETHHPFGCICGDLIWRLLGLIFMFCGFKLLDLGIYISKRGTNSFLNVCLYRGIGLCAFVFIFQGVNLICR